MTTDVTRPRCSACGVEVVDYPPGRVIFWRGRWFCDTACLERYRAELGAPPRPWAE